MSSQHDTRQPNGSSRTGESGRVCETCGNRYDKAFTIEAHCAAAQGISEAADRV